jgi:putative addiction module killer protein
MERRVLYYISREGATPFLQWFAGLDAPAAERVQTAVERLRHGNTSNVKSVGGGIAELKIAFGPGYRVYFGQDRSTTIILVGGGTKQRQHRDIAEAHDRWQDYKRRTRAGGG